MTDRSFSPEMNKIFKRLLDIKDRVEAAHEGPWFAEDCTEDGRCIIDDGRQHGLFPITAEWPEARFIAPSREDVPWLLNLIRVLFKMLKLEPASEQTSMNGVDPELYLTVMVNSLLALYPCPSSGTAIDTCQRSLTLDELEARHSLWVVSMGLSSLQGGPDHD